MLVTLSFILLLISNVVCSYKTLTQNFKYISHPHELAELNKEIEKVDEVALDLEADNQMFHYETKVCLIQIKVKDKISIIDPQSVALKKNPMHLQNFFNALSDRQLLMHGSDYDLRLLSEFYSYRPSNLFDTMIAATILNYEKKSLAALVEHEFNIKLEKKFQKSNWNMRPLSDEMLEYAAIDVVYLEDLRDILYCKLCDTNRLQWYNEMCTKLLNNTYYGFNKKYDIDPWRIKGYESLHLECNSPGLYALRALWNWRDEWAEEMNIAPYRLLRNKELLDIATECEIHKKKCEIPKQVKNIIRTSIGFKKRPDLRKTLISTANLALEEGRDSNDDIMGSKKYALMRGTMKAPLTEEQDEIFEEIRSLRDRAAANENLNQNLSLLATKQQMIEIALMACDDLNLKTNTLSKARNEREMSLKEAGKQVLMNWQSELIFGQ